MAVFKIIINYAKKYCKLLQVLQNAALLQIVS